MNNDFQTFLSFTDPEEAKVVLEKLNEKNIAGEINKIKPILDKGFIDIPVAQNIVLKINPQDFNRAHEVLNDYYSTQVDNVEKDYFLFAFTNEELVDVISKPQEWGHFNYQLAKKILRDRADQ